MAKFVSKENLETLVGRVAAKMNTKLSDPGNGEVGQVLVKTETGERWETIVPGNLDGECCCVEVSKTELDEILKGIKDTIEYVDLGLPSGLLWATCNLGAEKETDYGLYFQWGDTKGYKTACQESESDGNNDAHYFSWSKYKFGTQNNLTKYCTQSSYGVVDNKTVLDPEDDAVVAALGGQWRMPTKEEFQELIDNTDPGDGANNKGWITNYNGTGVSGLLRKSKTNGNTIFFPASGLCSIDSLVVVGQYGKYWSSSLYSSSSYYGQGLYFSSGGLGDYNNGRYDGLPVRGVKPKN